MNELKPCPFCGAEVKIEESNRFVSQPSTCTFGGCMNGHTETTYTILCHTDGCWITTARCYNNKEKLIREWNQRANIK